MLEYRHKARPSAYSLAAQVIRDEYVKNKRKPLSRESVQRLLKCTPGICFASGITLDDVLATLEKWKLIFRGKIAGLEGEHVISLDWPKGSNQNL